MEEAAMKKARIISVITSAIVLLALLPGRAFAGTNTVAGITLVTPNTYASCTATGDTITAQNNASVTLELKGQIIVQFVTDAGRVDIPGGFYPIDQTLNPGDSFQLAISYPPASTWPAFSNTNPTRELHVDVQLEIYQNGIFIGPIGYGQEWDVFCQNPPPPVFQGCTPGYYKNHVNPTSWASIDPTAKVNTVFSGALLDPTLGNSTLRRALSFQGGSTLAGAQQILLRAAVAAYINASHPSVDYPLTSSQVVILVNAALASTDRSFVISTASQLDSFNNLRCPLN
jgi:hypothetical protein